MEYKVLNNGLRMPMVGLGVYNISERETQRVVEDAVSVGYGKFSQPGIPGGSTLIFEIELLGIG